MGTVLGGEEIGLLGNGVALFTIGLGIIPDEGTVDGRLVDTTVGRVGKIVGLDWELLLDLFDEPSWETNLTTALTASEN